MGIPTRSYGRSSLEGSWKNTPHSIKFVRFFLPVLKSKPSSNGREVGNVVRVNYEEEHRERERGAGEDGSAGGDLYLCIVYERFVCGAFSLKNSRLA